MAIKDLFNHKQGKHAKQTTTDEVSANIDLSKKVINHLKGAPVTPDHVVDILRAAQDEPHAVTGIYQDKYIACGISGAELAKNGILDDSNALGELYSLFNSDQITNVTLMNDYSNYWLALVMDRKTVDALSELDFFVDNGDHLYFAWMAIPMTMDEDDDDSEDFHADELVSGDNNLITFNELCDAVERDEKVKVIDDKVVLYPRVGGDESDVDQAEIATESTGNDVDDGLPTADDITFGNEEEEPVTTPDDDEKPMPYTVETVDVPDVPDNDDTLNVPPVSDELTEDDYAAQMNSLMGTDVPDVDMNEDVAQDDDLQMRFKKESADVFQRNFKESLKAGVLNSDLQFNVDEKDFEKALSLGKAPQFDLETASDPISKDINAFKQECNAKLHNQWEKLLNATVNGYTNDLNNVIKQLLTVYSLDPDYHHDNVVTFGERKAKLDKEHQTALANIDEQVKEESIKLDNEYRQQRNEVGEQAKTLAEREYDQDHQAELQRRKDNLQSDARNRIDYNYNNALNTLLRQRRQLANTVFDKQQIAAMNKYKDAYQAGLDDLSRKFNKMNDRLREIVSKSYADKVAYEKSQADQANHDVKLKQLHDQIDDDKVAMHDLKDKQAQALQALRNEYEQKLAGAESDHQAELQRLDDENRKLLADTQSRLDKTLQELETKEEEWKHRQNNAVEQQHAKDVGVQNNLNAVIDSQRKQIESLRDQVDSNNKTVDQRLKRTNIIWGAGVVVCSLLFGVGGSMFGQAHAYNSVRMQTMLQGNHQQATPQPKIEVVTPNNDNSNSSSTSNSNSSSANSSSANTHSDRSSNK